MGTTVLASYFNMEILDTLKVSMGGEVGQHLLLWPDACDESCSEVCR